MDPFFFGKNMFVWGDWLRFQQVVTNVGMNAIKFTPPAGQVTINFDRRPLFVTSGEEQSGKEEDFKKNERNNSVEVMSETDIALRVTITDTGIGIPAAEIPKIFDPFYQVQNQFSAGGAGLGLYIVSEIVKAMKGSISCTSSKAGTTVIIDNISFPIATAEEVAIENKKISSSRWTPENAQRVHILLAEDNRLNQAVFKKLISSIGFRVTIVNDGQEAIDKWKEDPDAISLILMDLQMPVKDGWQAAKDIREEEQKQHLPMTPIVALTATTFPPELERAILAGMNETLTKPLQRYVLEESVFRILNANKLRVDTSQRRGSPASNLS